MIKKLVRAETFKKLCGYRNEHLKSPTPAEKEFMRLFIGWFPEIEIQTQKIIMKGVTTGYLLDFYLPEFKIAIEVDGGYHFEDDQMGKDKRRDEYLTGIRGIKMLRLPNGLVQNRPERCFKFVKSTIEKRKVEMVVEKVKLKREPTYTVLAAYTEKDFKRDNRYKGGPRKHRKITMVRSRP